MLCVMTENSMIPPTYDARQRELLALFDRCNRVCNDLVSGGVTAVRLFDGVTPDDANADRAHYDGRTRPLPAIMQITRALTILFATMARLMNYILSPRAPVAAPSGATAGKTTTKEKTFRRHLIPVPDTLGFIEMVRQLDRQARTMIRQDQQWRFGGPGDTAKARPRVARRITPHIAPLGPRIFSFADDGPLCPAFLRPGWRPDPGRAPGTETDARSAPETAPDNAPDTAPVKPRTPPPP